MTGCKCLRCGRYWSIGTQHPEEHTITSRWCPDCVPLVLPVLKLPPLHRGAA